MKIGGAEISREKWDEAEAGEEDDDDENLDIQMGGTGGSLIPAKRPGFHLPDWTRAPLPPGAPPAPRPPRLEVTA